MQTSSAAHPTNLGPNALRSILTLRDAGILTPEQAITKAAEVDEGFAFLINAPA